MNTTDQLLEKIEEKIRLYNLEWQIQPPVNLYQPVSYSMSAGGKRLRPLLVLLGYQLFGDDVDRAIPAAMAVEVFHNFTLLHDDIMDKAEKRRGQPTVHIKFTDNAAILSGDAMAFLAYRFLLQSQTDNIHLLSSLFTETALEVCEGQQFDMDFEKRTDVTTSEYIEMIRLKTAVLLGCALKAGAIIGEAPEKIADNVYQIGVNLGIAFQLQDDLLDTFGDEAEFGKNIGGDIVSNKKTFLLIEALENATGNQKTELNDWISKKEFDRKEKIEAVINIFNNLSIRDKTETAIRHYTELALNLINSLHVEPSRTAYLESLCRNLMNRNS
jgi:geranylgeranyl diphosphate synthase, type II